MRQKTKHILVAGAFLAGSVILSFTQNLSVYAEKPANMGIYESLPAAPDFAEKISGIDSNNLVNEEFSSHLPLVLLEIDGQIPEYKSFSDSKEIINDEEPYTTGSIKIFDGNTFNRLNDEAVSATDIMIKKRGHTSFSFAKPQYLIKSVLSKNPEEGQDNKNEVDFLGMGSSDSWILNGSLADKSLLRNYIAYRTASKIGGGNFAPDSSFCEVILKTDAGLDYQGVYLMMETVQRNPNRVDVSKYKEKEHYTSYIVRRDRFTNFDLMLDTYGRQSGINDKWIGLKYPSEEKLTDTARNYIEKDFSKIEQVIYSEDEDLFRTYDKYIDVDSFVDYFLVNEFFGNYDAGDHSTYMYKDNGGLLSIGPVWDFDQAMNNSFLTETDPLTLAFQDKTFFKELCRDESFVNKLKERYAFLRQNELSEDSINSLIDEAVNYLGPAQERDWSRWQQNYLDKDRKVDGSYYLDDYQHGNLTISRFNDDFDHEIYNLKTYLKLHGDAIQTELTGLKGVTDRNTQKSQYRDVIYVSVLALLTVPALLIGRRA